VSQPDCLMSSHKLMDACARIGVRQQSNMA
jgi:hypothetical protein